MARITVEDCLRKENNRFALVLLAAKRTKQLLKGARALIPEAKNKPVVTSLREIADGKVRFMTEEEKAEFEERARLRNEQASFAPPVEAPKLPVSLDFSGIDDDFAAPAGGAKSDDDE